MKVPSLQFEIINPDISNYLTNYSQTAALPAPPKTLHAVIMAPIDCFDKQSKNNQHDFWDSTNASN